MINDMKLGIRLLRYAYGIKINLVLLIGCVAADMLFFVLELMGILFPLDGYLLLAVGMIPVQLLFSLNAVNFVLASPARKKLQTSVPAALNGCAMLGAYLIIILKKTMTSLVYPDKIAQKAAALVYLAFLAALMTAFTGMIYKSFIAYMVMFFPLCGSIVFFMGRISEWDVFENRWISLVWGALIGIALITAGTAIQYALSVLFYRKPVSKRVLGGQLSRQL